MTTTQITTAARRITRHANAAPSTIRYYYDNTGTVIHAHEAGMFPANKTASDALAAATEGTVYKANGMDGTGRRITQREAQDALDAFQQAGGFGDEYDYLVNQAYHRNIRAHEEA